MLTLDSFNSHWKLFSENRSLVVALSGGIDSVVLLHLLVSLKQRGSDFSLRAIHINHQLCNASEEWAQFCADLCVSWDVPYNTYSVSINQNSGLGIEAAARLARYQTLDESCRYGESLVMAHHQMDQVETLLLRLIRGSGIKGMSAMSSQSHFNQRNILRPLLLFSKELIEEYAHHHRLVWVEDSSNLDIAFDRNYIRHQVLPILKRRWPSVVQTMARSSQHCYFSNQLLDHYLSQDLIRLKQGCQLSVDGLKSMPSIKQHPLLRAWLIEQDCPLPDTHQLNTMMTDVVYAKRDAIPCVKWKGYELRRYCDLLYVMPKLMCFDRDIEYVWNLQEDLVIKPLGLTLQAKSQAVRDIQQIYQISQVTVRFRQGGERLSLRGYHQTLSKYFQQARIPTWLRDRMPLLFMGDKLIFVWLEDWELSLS